MVNSTFYLRHFWARWIIYFSLYNIIIFVFIIIKDFYRWAIIKSCWSFHLSLFSIFAIKWYIGVILLFWLCWFSIKLLLLCKDLISTLRIKKITKGYLYTLGLLVFQILLEKPLVQVFLLLRLCKIRKLAFFNFNMFLEPRKGMQRMNEYMFFCFQVNHYLKFILLAHIILHLVLILSNLLNVILNFIIIFYNVSHFISFQQC